MPFKSMSFVLAVILFMLSCCPLVQAAEPLAIPVFLKYSLMQQLMLKEMFKGPGHTAVYRLDSSGCSNVTFAKPHLSGADALLQVKANVLLKLSTADEANKCSVAKYWSGSTLVKGKPVILGADALTVKFKVVSAEVFDAHGVQISSGLVQNALEGHLNPLLDQFKVNLKPQLKQLNSVLPFMLPGYSQEQIQALIASVRLGTIEVGQDGLNIKINMMVDKASMLNMLPELL